MWKFSVAVLGSLYALATPVAAFTLTNSDDETYALHVIVGEGGAGNAAADSFELRSGKTIDFCNMGCTVLLDNGSEGYFEGDMIVIIQKGEFFVTSKN